MPAPPALPRPALALHRALHKAPLSSPGEKVAFSEQELPPSPFLD